MVVLHQGARRVHSTVNDASGFPARKWSSDESARGIAMTNASGVTESSNRGTMSLRGHAGACKYASLVATFPSSCNANFKFAPSPLAVLSALRTQFCRFPYDPQPDNLSRPETARRGACEFCSVPTLANRSCQSLSQELAALAATCKYIFCKTV